MVLIISEAVQDLKFIISSVYSQSWLIMSLHGLASKTYPHKFHYKFLYSYYQLEPPAGLEPVITTLKGLRPNRLDDGGIYRAVFEQNGFGKL